jgi:hypothetical protein
MSKKLADQYSFSKLEVYEKCSELYRLTYETQLPDIRQDTFHTRLGTFCHTSLEDFYGCEDGTITSPYDALVRKGGIWDRELERCGLSMLKPDIMRYANHIVKLYERAHWTYQGKDPIRAPKDPTATKVWTDYVRSFGLDRMAAKIQNVAAETSKDWESCSLPEVVGASLGIMYMYRHPTVIDSIVAIELPLSEAKYAAADSQGKKMEGVETTKRRGPHPVFKNNKGETELLSVDNPFFMPEDAGDRTIKRNKKSEVVFSSEVMFNGYIDLVARDKHGRLILIDHKTNKEEPSVDKVAIHEQLLAYGFAIYHLTGEMPHKIGINHLRSSKLVLADFDIKKAEEVLERWLAIQNAAKNKIYIKQNPYAFNSRCITMDFKTKKNSFCPGFKHCHPDLWAKHHDNVIEEAPTVFMESF